MRRSSEGSSDRSEFVERPLKRLDQTRLAEVVDSYRSGAAARQQVALRNLAAQRGQQMNV